MTGYAIRAEMLTADAADLGRGLAELNAAAWTANVDPEATRGLVRAAITLNPDAGSALWARTPPVPSRARLFDATDEAVAALTELGRLAQALAGECETTAGAAAAEARNPDGDPAAARAVIADCEAALDTLAGLAGALDCARTALGQVPEQYATAYEIPLAFTRDGGTVTHDSRFLTAGAA